MARHPKHRPRRKNIQIHQDSPFLNLPGEIRIQIYRASLTRPTPIDLWPRAYVETPENYPSLAQRIAKTRNKFHNECRDANIPKFRRQDDLQFVRMEMATGLLTTCKQIYNEASKFFWSDNIFRFSGDIEWFGVRRFLSEIGPGALSQIRSLEVFAPVAETNCLDTSSFDGEDRMQRIEFYTDIREAKNVPKMHMVKARKEPWTGRGVYINGGLELENVNFALKRNVEHVCYLLSASKTSPELRFILPQGFAMNRPRRRSARNQPIRRDEMRELYISEQLLRVGPYVIKSMNLVIEAGASLNSLNIPGDFTSQGINVVCEPGSFLKRYPDLNAEYAEITELKRWIDPGSEYDYLVGVSSLLDESESFSVAALGGKATKSPGKRKTERVMRGFGGC
jgi:hypothetical protein